MKSDFGFDKIVCVGKNYLDHAMELGDAVPEEPIFFFKPPSCLVAEPTSPIELPAGRGAVHHECEIVYRISRAGERLSFDGVTLGLDLTLRDVQNEAKKRGGPWEASKAFPHSAIIGRWLPIFEGLMETPFDLSVNGTVKQSSTGAKMRRPPADLLRIADQLFTLCNGDLFFTGTPAGVGPIRPADRLSLRFGDQLNYEVEFR